MGAGDSKASKAGEPQDLPDKNAPAKITATAKSIVLFSDGTGNSSAKLFKTNVFRLYEAVDLGPTVANQQRQIAFYDNGVGTSAFRPLRMLQGVFGFGLKRNVLEIYSYACRNYDPDSVPLAGSGIDERGDHIYGFGFSRGAFTMRLAIGLIADQGLIPYKDDQDLAWRVGEAWKRFRTKWPRSIERVLGWLKPRTEAPRPPADALRAAKGAREEDRYHPSQNHRPIIRFVGVWDTVAAYGGPITEITRAIDNFIYRLSMPNYELHPRVRRARHALALDDSRDSFLPLLWDELAEDGLQQAYSRKAAPWLHDERLMQVWFAGMHADVGGGYPDESLSYVSLLWMLEEAHECGLRTVDFVTDRYHGLANSFGPVHDSRAGVAGYYRYQPRRIESWMNVDPGRTMSLRDPTIRDASNQQKGLIGTVRVHASVIARIASGTDGYAPIVLPADFSVVPAGGLAETKLLETSGAKPTLTAAEIRRAVKANPPPLVSSRILAWLGRPNAKQGIADDMEAAWNKVWSRRAVYFLTVLSTVLLFTLPWWIPPEIERVTDKDAGIVQLPVIEATGDAIGNLLRMIGEVLPSFVHRWIDEWAAHPYWSLSFVGLIVVLMWFGKRLERRIADIARAAWHQAIPRIPPASAGDEPESLTGGTAPALASIRNSFPYQRGIQLFKWLLLPNLVVAPILLVAIFWLLHAVALQFALPFVEAGRFCQSSAAATEISQLESEFHTAADCNPTGGSVTAGETYTITFDVTVPWADESYEATPVGIAAGDMRWGIGYFAAPMRRAIGSRYLLPLAAVRKHNDGKFHFVRLRPLQMVVADEDPNRFQAEFEAPADGELFLFANDAILLWDPEYFYKNNAGAARVGILSETHAAAIAAAAEETGRDQADPTQAGEGTNSSAQRPEPPPAQ